MVVTPAVDPVSMNSSDPMSYPVDRVELSAVEKATRAHRKKAEISPATEVATSKPVSGPVGFVDSAIEVVDLEPICSSVAPLPGKLSWINSIGSGMWLRGRTPRINWEEGRLIKAFDFRFRNNKSFFYHYK